MDKTELDMLASIKTRIEKLSGLAGKSDWADRDYEFLVYYIQSQTEVRLSLSTVKRIWRNKFNRLPHKTTLDALSELAYEKDWLSLKKDWLEKEEQKPVHTGKVKKKSKKHLIYGFGVLTLLIIAAIILTTAFGNKSSISSKDLEKVRFSYKRSIEGTVPNTVVFNYDIESIEADSFFLQQSWDRSRRVQIFKGASERTDIYYVPGYFMAKLLADDQVIKEIPIHITYEDWFMAARQPVSNIRSFDKSYWIKENYLGTTEEALKSKKIDLERDFQLAFYYVKEFGVDGDNFRYRSKFRMEPLEAVKCPIFSLQVQAEKGYFWIMFGKKGCESELNLQLNDSNFYGKTKDLTAFGTDVYGWQQVEVITENKKVLLVLNGNEIFSGSYDQAMGQIMEISFFFNGMGMVDEVELRDGNDKIKFSEDFDGNDF